MTTTPEADAGKEVEIQEVNAKNSKLEAIEFLCEMAGYPQLEYGAIAKRMNIPQSTARDYLKRYIWGVLQMKRRRKMKRMNLVQTHKGQ